MLAKVHNYLISFFVLLNITEYSFSEVINAWLIDILIKCSYLFSPETSREMRSEQKCFLLFYSGIFTRFFSRITRISTRKSDYTNCRLNKVIQTENYFYERPWKGCTVQSIELVHVLCKLTGSYSSKNLNFSLISWVIFYTVLCLNIFTD